MYGWRSTRSDVTALYIIMYLRKSLDNFDHTSDQIAFESQPSMHIVAPSNNMNHCLIGTCTIIIGACTV